MPRWHASSLRTGPVENSTVAWKNLEQAVNYRIVIDAGEYGVQANGTHDDTSGIQQAVNDVANIGGIVQLPDGVCLISTQYNANVCLAIPDNVVLCGAGKYRTTLAIAPGLNTTVYALMNKGSADGKTGTARHNQNIELRDFGVTSLTTGTLSGGNTHRGVVFWPVTNYLLENLYIHDLPDDGVTEHFGIYIAGDDAGNTTTFSRCDGWVAKCRTDNCGSGVGVQNTAGVAVLACRAKGNKRFQGFTFSANGPGITTYDCVIRACIADSNGNGIEIESSSVTAIGNISRLNDAAGIRLTAGSSDCLIQGNRAYNNNQSTIAGPRNAGIVLDNIAALPHDNIVTANRCYDNQAIQTQLYGIAQDTAVQGQNNLIANNNCRGNKTAPTLNVTLPTQIVVPGGTYNLTGGAAVPTGLSASYAVETDSHLLITLNATVDWASGTAPANLNDEVAAFVRLDAVNASPAGVLRCVVAGTGKAQLTLVARTTVTAGAHTVDATVSNTGARGQLSNFTLDTAIIPCLQ